MCRLRSSSAAATGARSGWDSRRAELLVPPLVRTLLHLLHFPSPTQPGLTPVAHHNLRKSGRPDLRRGEVELRSNPGEGAQVPREASPVTRAFSATSPYGRGVAPPMPLVDEVPLDDWAERIIAARRR